MDWSLLLEFFYLIMGMLIVATAVAVWQDKTNEKRMGSALFWFILGCLFAFGKWISSELSGILIIILGLLSAFKQVQAGEIEIIPQLFREKGVQALGNKIFLPSITIALSAFVYATFLPSLLPEAKSIAGNLSISLAGITGLIVALIVCRAPVSYVVKDSSRLIRLMGPTNILPQLLAALGAIFTAAGVGELISCIFVTIIPSQNSFAGIVAYCLGMFLFTIIMGNSFAAFTVITIGIGIPFVYNLGANPALIGAMALTAGYCGTLITPMAANFNIVPGNLLEIKDPYGIIKFQFPFAIALLAIHIILMYLLGFVF